jgi:hypothetical protein
MKLISSAALLCSFTLSVLATFEHEITSKYASDVLPTSEVGPKSTSSCESNLSSADETVLPETVVSSSDTSSCTETGSTKSAYHTAEPSHEVMDPIEEPKNDKDLDCDLSTEEEVAPQIVLDDDLNASVEANVIETPQPSEESFIDPTDLDENLYSGSIRNTVKAAAFLLTVVIF